jgi:hypothetical protein
MQNKINQNPNIMKTSTPRFLLLTTMMLVMLGALQAQVTIDTIWTSEDLTLGSGTGQEGGDYKDRNLGAGGSLQMCNFDHNESLMSYFESWVKFDLTGLEVPDGQDILYAEILFRVSANTGQGYYAYHLMNIDDWVEGTGSGSNPTEDGLTWTQAQDLDYENEANYTLVNVNPLSGGTSYVEEFNITAPVLYEMGAEGNKTLTLRLEPFIKEYDPETMNKEWLGFYAREAPWDRPEGSEFNPHAGRIIFYIGPPEPKQFSDLSTYGNIDSYTRTPSKYGYWLVRENEDDTRLILSQRPAPINKTPGGYAIYEGDPQGDFEITLDAKLNKVSGDALDPKADFIVVFGYEGPMDYSYMRFTGEAINGFYKVDTVGGGRTIEIGDLNATPAVTDTMFHAYKIVRTGTTVTVYIDDAEYISVTDDALGTEGLVGMGSYNDIALFDNFKAGEEEPISAGDNPARSLSIYPNPAGDRIHVDAGFKIQEVRISNILGQTVLKLQYNRSGIMELNTSDLDPGIYFLTIKGTNGERNTEKVIIE